MRICHQENNIVKCSDIVQVIEARVKEVFQIIRKMMSDNNLIGKVESVVLTGQGISNIVGAEELTTLTLKINQVRICSPKLINIIRPQHTTVYGMVRYIANLGVSKHVNSDVAIITDPTIKDKIFGGFGKIKNNFANLFKKAKRIDDIK